MAAALMRRGSEGDVGRADVDATAWEEPLPAEPAPRRPSTLRSRASSGELDVMLERAVRQAEAGIVVSIPKSRQQLTPPDESITPPSPASHQVSPREGQTPVQPNPENRSSSSPYEPLDPIGGSNSRPVPSKSAARGGAGRGPRNSAHATTSTPTPPGYPKKYSPPFPTLRQNSNSSGSNDGLFYPPPPQLTQSHPSPHQNHPYLQQRHQIPPQIYPYSYAPQYSQSSYSAQSPYITAPHDLSNPYPSYTSVDPHNHNIGAFVQPYAYSPASMSSALGSQPGEAYYPAPSMHGHVSSSSSFQAMGLGLASMTSPPLPTEGAPDGGEREGLRVHGRFPSPLPSSHPSTPQLFDNVHERGTSAEPGYPPYLGGFGSQHGSSSGGMTYAYATSVHGQPGFIAASPDGQTRFFSSNELPPAMYDAHSSYPSPLPSSPSTSQGFSPYRPVVFLPHNQAAYEAYLSTPPPPQPYSPPDVELARGLLAQANLHDVVYNRRAPQAGSPAERDRARKSSGGRSALPKPPAHSPYALWAGNVPSDSSHAELWRFFTLRPPPAAGEIPQDLLENESANVDLHSTGVESIHLIARSNCAFVNYASNIHLQHAIKVCHGASLRPFDSRCKDLVCRARKREDDNKSGVGAQRTGGLHHAYLAAKKRFDDVDSVEGAVDGSSEPPGGMSGKKHRSSSGSHSVSTTSTTSSYLSRHFPKRYFVLKSHNEDDLKLSLERGLWATQSHNEPVLDQAFRSCKDGVILFFSANKSGEWFGYARMASPISNSQDRHISWAANKVEGSSSSRTDPPSPSRPATIPEEDHLESSSLRPAVLFSPSEERFTDHSPLPLTPSNISGTTNKARGDSAPAKLTAARAAILTMSGEHVGENLHLPVEKRGESLPEIPRKLDDLERDALEQVLLDQEAAGASSGPAELDDDGVWRKDTLPSAEERNARLDKLADVTSHEINALASGWGKPFKVEWIKCHKLPFSRTRSILNGFNASREIKISRDGTEVEPQAGEALIAEFWKDDGGVPLALGSEGA